MKGKEHCRGPPLVCSPVQGSLQGRWATHHPPPVVADTALDRAQGIKPLLSSEPSQAGKHQILTGWPRRLLVGHFPVMGPSAVSDFG